MLLRNVTAVLLLLSVALLATASTRSDATFSKTPGPDYQLREQGHGWTVYHRRQARAIANTKCGTEVDADGHLSYVCAACFNPVGTVFRLAEFASELKYAVDFGDLVKGGDFSFSVDVPFHKCVKVPDVPWKRDGTNDSPLVREKREICTPKSVNVDIPFSALFDALGTQTVDLTLGQAAVRFSVIRVFLVSGCLLIPRLLQIDPPGISDLPSFLGAPDIFGDACLKMKVDLCEMDPLIELIYADRVLTSASLRDLPYPSLQLAFAAIDALKEASCASKMKGLATASPISFDEATGTVSFCPPILGRSFTYSPCFSLHNLIFSQSGLQACIAASMAGNNYDLGCFRVGEVTDCTTLNCSGCIADDRCGWCASKGICMPKNPIESNPCDQCVGGLEFDDADMICQVTGGENPYEDCIRRFRRLDSERDYQLTLLEFQMGPGKWMSLDEAERHFNILDSDGDGVVLMEEYCQLVLAR
ncbi:hypothetical protein QOT17_008331 [Balamuthia mandrillaris]